VSAVLYKKMQSKSSVMLKKYGQLLAFTRTVKGDYDPATRQATSSSSTFTSYCLSVEVSKLEVQNSAVKKGEIFLLGEGAKEFKIGDTVSIDSIVYRINTANPIKPATISVLWELSLVT